MREIKFRGKPIGRYAHLGWIDGFYTGGERPRIYGYDGVCSYDVEPETVGQYTGLKDKNGVEIYEGDVLKFSWDSIGERVEFYGVVRFCEVGAAFRYWEERFKVWSTFCSFKSKEMEVVGNIFDDPEFEKKFGEIYREEQ